MNTPLHIIGLGPVGLVAAIRAAETRPVSLYVPVPAADSRQAGATGENRQTSDTRVGSIEAIPASLLALLVELGIHPHRLGVEDLHKRRCAAWESEQPVCDVIAPMAHIERPALEHALMERVGRRPEIAVVELQSVELHRAVHELEGDVFDATGRRAVTAVARHTVSGAPLARTWTRRVSLSAEERSFRIAALPDGYVYRLASMNTALIGWCGEPHLLHLPPSQWAGYLQRAGAQWLDSPEFALASPDAHWRLAKAGGAGIQWAEARAGFTPIGDAAYSRDTLSSQGLALGFSDALYAVAAVTEDARRLWNENRRGQFLDHLIHLREQVSRCRFRESPFWRSYSQRIEEASSRLTPATALRRARLRRGAIAPA